MAKQLQENESKNDINQNDINNQFSKQKPSDFSGYWETYRIENFDAFLDDLDLSWVMKKLAALMVKKTVYFKIKQNDDKV